MISTNVYQYPINKRLDKQKGRLGTNILTHVSPWRAALGAYRSLGRDGHVLPAWTSNISVYKKVNRRQYRLGCSQKFVDHMDDLLHVLNVEYFMEFYLLSSIL